MSSRRHRQFVRELFQSKSTDVERFLRFRIRNPEDARDLSQEAFLRLLRLDRSEFIRRPDQYLMRIAANLAYEHRLREKSRAAEALGDVPEQRADAADEPEVRFGQQREVQTLEQVLGTLPPNVRAALVWHRRDGLTYREIADKLGVSASMVKKYLQQGIARCRQGMQEVRDET